MAEAFEKVMGIVGVVIGVILIVQRKAFARMVVRGQNATWGFNFGERERRWSERVAIPIGIGFIVAGVLTLLGVFPIEGT